MKNSLRTLLPAAIAAAATLATAPGCSVTGCMDNRSSLLLAGFYSASTQKAVALKDIELGGVGAPHDSLLIDARATASEVYLPLRHTSTSTSFFIRYLDTYIDLSASYDTITLTYTSTPYFASEECGAIYRYNIRSLHHTTHFIDSIALLDSLIDNTDRQKMHIYFTTD